MSLKKVHAFNVVCRVELSSQGSSNAAGTNGPALSSWVQLLLTEIHRKIHKWNLEPAYILKRLHLLPWITRRIWDTNLCKHSRCLSCQKLEDAISMSVTTDMNQQSRILKATFPTFLIIILLCSITYLSFLEVVLFPPSYFFFPQTCISPTNLPDLCNHVISWKSHFSFIKTKWCFCSLWLSKAS